MRTAVAATILVSLFFGPAAEAQVPPGAPSAFLASRSGEVRAEFQVYCWFEDPPMGVCLDRFDPVDPPVALTVEAGETLTLRFDRPYSPTDITVFRHDSPPAPGSPATSSFAVPAGNPTQFTADLPPGTSFLTVNTNWGPRGGVTYVFEVTVVAPGASCTGLTPTITGTSARDRLVGTPGADVILAGTGNDVVLGLGGADVLCGGDGNDILLGHNGDDIILGGPGRDLLLGGPGADALHGGTDVDLCLGHEGADAASTCERTFAVP